MRHIFRNPEEYNKHSRLQKALALQLLEAANIKKTDRVLDVGCGDGWITNKIAAMVPKGFVTGIDMSSDMIKFAAKTYGLRRKNIEFKIMNAEAISFGRRQYDVVVSFCCLHWVAKQRQALMGINGVLKEKGQAIFLVAIRHNELYDAIDSTTYSKKWRKYFKTFTNPRQFFEREQYIKLLKEAGFYIGNVLEETTQVSFSDEQDMMLWLKAAFPHKRELPEHLRVAFFNDVVEKFLTIQPKSKGKIIMPFRTLQVFVSKPALQLKKRYTTATRDMEPFVDMSEQKKLSAPRI